MLKKSYIILVVYFYFSQAFALYIVEPNFNNCKEGQELAAVMSELLTEWYNNNSDLNEDEEVEFQKLRTKFSDLNSNISEEDMNHGLKLVARCLRNDRRFIELREQLPEVLELVIKDGVIEQGSPALLLEQEAHPRGVRAYVRILNMLPNAVAAILLAWHLYNYERTGAVNTLINICSIGASWTAYKYSTSRPVLYAGLLNLIYQWNVMLGTPDQIATILRFIAKQQENAI